MSTFANPFNNIVSIYPIMCIFPIFNLKISRAIKFFSIFNFHHCDSIKDTPPNPAFTNEATNLDRGRYFNRSFNNSFTSECICINTVWIITVIGFCNKTTYTCLISYNISLNISFFDITPPYFTGNTTYI
ncbi:Uncharacterised protein [Streptococcus pneumoniae]|nr:Uncharacterised protein [Streptococcus pneumoniae]VIZ81001.1 Uncharacterised protein [Streptococcus pneumoniae]VOM09222.1 Uncharacterised protein [Streptococcus pneumoniae]